MKTKALFTLCFAVASLAAAEPASSPVTIPAPTPATPAPTPHPALEATAKALRLFPDLGVAGSPTNVMFLSLRKVADPATLARADWPLVLAKAAAIATSNQPMRAEPPKKGLTGFKLIRARFEIRKGRFMDERVIVIAVANNTGKAVSRFYATGTLASPGRAIPWAKETFNYEISGGMEPGESREFQLTPNMMSKLASVEFPPDANFTVVITRIDGADGEAIMDSESAQ